MTSNPEPFTVPDLVSFTKLYHHRPVPYISPTRPSNAARSKNVLVTGGGTGIGKATAIAFLQAGAASVSILGRREAPLSSTADQLLALVGPGGKTQVHFEVADFLDKQAVDAAFARITAKFGPIDVLVSNVGAAAGPSPLATGDAEQFTRYWGLNVITALHALQAFVPRTSKHPVVINVTSAMAHASPAVGVSSYAVSKAANLKLMNYFAAENPRIRVVNLHPGIIDTDIGGGINKSIAQDVVDLPGHFCVWLASDEAKFLSGRLVWANWDAEELVARKEEIEGSRLLTWCLDGVPM